MDRGTLLNNLVFYACHGMFPETGFVQVEGNVTIYE